MRNLIKNKKGEAYIELCVSVIVLMSVLAIGIYVMAFAVARQTVDAICYDLLEVATTTGEFGDEFNEADATLRELYFDYTLEVDGDWFNETEKTVQLGHRMTITISYTTYIQAWAGVKVPVDIVVTRQGLSQNYWK